MPILPLASSRISLNLKSYNVLNSVRFNQFGMFRVQNQLATGLRFQAPSEDPGRAASAMKLDRAMDTLKTIGANVGTANGMLAEGETAVQDAVDLVREAHRLALESVNDVTAEDERGSLAVVAGSLMEQLVSVANRKHLDTFLFSGRYGDGEPFEQLSDGVVYRGDDGRMQTAVEHDYSWDSFTIPGSSFFNAVSNDVRGWADLNPSLAPQTRIEDLRGATGAGVSLGRVTVSQGASEATIDLTGAATVGDVLDRLNAEMPPPLQASIGANGINIGPTSGAGDILVTDVAGGRTAIDLGIFSNTRAASIVGGDLDPTMTGTTTLAQLNGGAGLDLSAGVTIRNGNRTAVVTFSGAETVESVLNRINLADVGVWAKVSDNGNSIDVLNRISGTDLRIEEFGGRTASALGIRSMHEGTKLADLNDGLGIDSMPGGDFRISTADGTNIDFDVNQVDLSSGTLQDLIDYMNNTAAGSITASLTTNGNGIVIRDNTIGPNNLAISRLNISPAIDSLGLNVAASSGGVMQGNDINPIRVNSPFTALVELRRGLEANDTRAIDLAGRRLGETLTQMQRVQGEMAAKAKAMVARTNRIESSKTDTQIRQSDVRDVDMTEAIVKFQQFDTALQANLQTASKVLGMSLLDYLR